MAGAVSTERDEESQVEIESRWFDVFSTIDPVSFRVSYRAVQKSVLLDRPFCYKRKESFGEFCPKVISGSELMRASFRHHVFRWVAAAVVPVLLCGQAAAQSPQLVDRIARNDGDWRTQVRDYLIGNAGVGDRSQITERAMQLIKNLHERCRTGGCGAAGSPGTPGGPGGLSAAVQDVAKLASGAVCAAYPIDTVCVRRWTVPRNIQAYDFDPPRAPVYPGMTPIRPGDARITGGERGVRYNDAYPASGDSLLDVKTFKVPAPNGLLRISLVSGKRPLAQALSSPFGRTLTANGRPFDIVAAGPDKWIPRGALATGTPQQVFVANNILPGSAPSIIFEVENTQGFVELTFPQGAEIGALLIEPASQPSTLVLDSTARGSGVLTNDTCLREQEKLDKLLAALPQSAPPPRNNPPPPPSSPPPPPVSRN